MHQFADKLKTGKVTRGKSGAWRLAIDSVFGAAVRLHKYRDARDVLLRHVIHEQELRTREKFCCDEQW